ncbi:5' nucleotidase, NT5C type [Emticicia sp. C21]|uniref:5' nucleotidase, NT5C type n=1 Tax=Emticicia sp. C21 TaxID=2302915 RepID=UPI000E34DED1|nr:5'-3'-deoxyribonucleotidase [Emticicia sp. C21]RFS14240.1 5'-3'-deoxyribonucleotidase [Emticicia sp. C21]
MTKKRIAIDMDDVMAATGRKILKTYNHINSTAFTEEHFENKSYFEIFEEKNYHKIREEVFKPGFFRDVEVMADAIEVVKKLHKKYEVFIVSAATEFPNSLKDKMDWLEEHFPFISWRNIVLCGDKSIVAADYMIDDHEKNLKTFKGKTLMFSAIHNQKVDGYQRFKSWKEIEAFFDSEN